MKVAAKVPRAPDEHKAKVRNARNAKKKGHIVLLQERAKYAKNERESRGGPGWAQKGVLPIRPFCTLKAPGSVRTRVTLARRVLQIVAGAHSR